MSPEELALLGAASPALLEAFEQRLAGLGAVLGAIDGETLLVAARRLASERDAAITTCDRRAATAIAVHVALHEASEAGLGAASMGARKAIDRAHEALHKAYSSLADIRTEAPPPAGGTWGWGSSPECIDGREDTRDEAIAAAREELGPGARCWIFPEVHDVGPAAYAPSAVDIVDGAAADAHSELPDSMQDERWPDATLEQLAELDAFLTAWFRRIASPMFRSFAQSEEIIT